MRIHHKLLNEPWFHLIKDGRKTIEVRTNDDKNKIINVGDAIIWNDTLKVFVIKINKYNSFLDMFENENLGDVLPDVPTIADGLKIYHDMPGYREKEKLGVLAFHLQVIKK